MSGHFDDGTTYIDRYYPKTVADSTYRTKDQLDDAHGIRVRVEAESSRKTIACAARGNSTTSLLAYAADDCHSLVETRAVVGNWVA